MQESPRTSESNQPLSLAALCGVAFGLFIVLCSALLSSRSPMAFFSLEGLLIVVGGVIAVAFMSFEAEHVRASLRAIAQMFRKPEITNETLHWDMIEVINWARIIKEKGMRELEARIGGDGADDPFVKYGLNMVVSRYSPREVRSMMTTAADAAYERDSVPVDVLQAMTSHAPAFGMVGTLVGMVTMLYKLDSNVSSIGASLAVSFLSTLYGVLSARMVYMPAAAKLRQRAESRRFRHHLITEGLVMLVSNKTPMYIQDRLNSFLRPEAYDYFHPAKASAPIRLTPNRSHADDMGDAEPAAPRLRAVGL